MSTAALSAPHLEVTAPDTMDVHSDSGLDFGDGDIDLDLRSTGGMDDDVSLRDAATDQDDFMADNEDLIEEDVGDEDVEVDIDLPPAEDTAPDHADAADLDEDLIDYSDDEDAAVEEAPIVADAQDAALEKAPIVADAQDSGNVDNVVTATDGDKDLVAKDPSESDGRDGAEETVSQHGSTPLADQGDQVDLSVVEAQSLPATQPSSDQTTSQEQDPTQNDVKPGLQASGKDDSATVERRPSDPKVNPSATVSVEDHSTEQSGELAEDVSRHPVTINYDGAELWLFKRHDYDDSGDYLLDDDSLLTKPVSALLDACREALGADVSDDLELGIRLDSLHSIDLYSEHSSCYFVKLSDLIHVYLQLHAQDGVTEPESFYITVLSRPRVSSLFTELVNAAADGIGHSGLNSAISAGQTCFNAHFTHNSTEQVYGDWDHDESPVENDIDGGEQDHHEREYYEDNEGEHNYTPHDDDDKEEHGEEQYQEEHIEQAIEGIVGNGEEEKVAAAVKASDEDTAEKVESSTAEHVEQSIGNTTTSEQHTQEPQGDLLYYSDDEHDDEAPGSQAQVTRSSSASATVQGDDPPQVPDNGENVAQDKQQSEQDFAAEEAAHDESANVGDENLGEYEGDHNYSYGEFDAQHYGEAYEGEYEQDYNEGHGFEEYPAYDVVQANDDNTNYPGDLGQYSSDHAGGLTVAAGPSVDNSDAVDGSYETANDFLDLDDTADTAQTLENEHAAEDEIDFSDDEDGAGSQAPVAASAAADTVATSSSGLHNLSPQGQKRTIDEVGNDAVDATSSTDAKRPRV